MSDVFVGFNGHCKDHPSHGFVIKPEPPMGDARIHSAMAQHSKCGALMFGRVQQLHCAAGHVYSFLDVSEMIHDPFTEDETIRITVDESARIMREGR